MKGINVLVVVVLLLVGCSDRTVVTPQPTPTEYQIHVTLSSMIGSYAICTQSNSTIRNVIDEAVMPTQVRGFIPDAFVNVLIVGYVQGTSSYIVRFNWSELVHDTSHAGEFCYVLVEDDLISPSHGLDELKYSGELFVWDITGTSYGGVQMLPQTEQGRYL